MTMAGACEGRKNISYNAHTIIYLNVEYTEMNEDI